MLKNNERLFAYPFKGYWKDVGTIYSLWEANMELLEETPKLNLYDPGWHIYSRNPAEPPHYISVSANVKCCIAAGGGIIGGDVYHSVLFSGVYIGKGSKVANSILMPNVRIGENTIIENAIIAENTIIGDNCFLGCGNSINKELIPEMTDSDITVIGENMVIPDGIKIGTGSMIDNDSFIVYQAVV
jgi:glucose-1-phosphate adenylyltransferase